MNTFNYSSTVNTGKSFLGFKNSLNNILISPPKGMNFTFQAKTKSQKPLGKNQNSEKNFKYIQKSKPAKKKSIQPKNVLNASCVPSMIKESTKGKIRNAISSKKIRNCCNNLASSNSAKNRFKSPLKDKFSNFISKLEFPISSINLIKYLKEDLTEYEKKELIDYDVIYFIGKNKNKLNPEAELINRNNNVYDDESHNYKTVVGDHINYRYEILQIIGKGSFGLAIKCLDHKTQKYVAIKILRNKKKYAYQTTVEIGILSLLKNEDPEDITNTIKIIEHFTFRNHAVNLN